ncbi:DUF397 domain-containing protein [Streptomyces sp. NPDC059866]|uniref:DUF397 domain-containing protein n=1 Tax=Streptomyces sp. NPDC059866 TaxID=3346978 RepID=UPI0036642EFB
MSTDLDWFRSSYSGGEGECVEIALKWTKSSYSGSGGGECLEIAPTPTTIHIRDSKTPTGPTITLSSPAWTAFLPHVTA